MVEFSPDELELLRDKVTVGVPRDLKTKIPDAPDISSAPKSVPGTFKNRIEGLTQARPDEIPVPGKHFVIWGSKLLNDIYARPIRKPVHVTEDAYAEKMRGEASTLMAVGVKNPLHRGLDRDDRAEQYARWRYKGFVCGEVASL